MINTLIPASTELLVPTHFTGRGRCPGCQGGGSNLAGHAHKTLFKQNYSFICLALQQTHQMLVGQLIKQTYLQYCKRIQTNPHTCTHTGIQPFQLYIYYVYENRVGAGGRMYAFIYLSINSATRKRCIQRLPLMSYARQNSYTNVKFLLYASTPRMNVI